ncbi:MAG: sugar phosphate isomerase/epimerase [Clostridia bacterium]|nr:sugar phosphate isomerase/epimerase [Clostridia bacterium]
MKLGAQLYSVRDLTQTAEGLDKVFSQMKEIGYDIAQLSAIGPIDAGAIREIIAKYSMPVTCTHTAFDRIVDDTDAVIRDHIAYGCPTIGVGSMPEKFRNSFEGVREFVKVMREPMKKIEAAGLSFAYHNHHFEFNAPEGGDYFDVLIEEAPTMNFILDTFWFVYANRDPMKYIRDLGVARIKNVHFKDMKEYHTMLEPDAPKHELICPCGTGIIQFKPIITLCDELGIVNALVEQDNAPATGDSVGQMRISHDNLRPLF